MINRKNIPALSPLSIPAILPHTKQVLPNGIEIISIHDPAQEVFKIDIVFEAGARYQPRPLIASTTINMLNEGTKRHNSGEIAELFDYYGTYLDYNCGMNKAELSLISLNKYGKEAISMLAEMISESVFPEKELEIFLRNKRQEFLVSIEKTAYLARKEFASLLFGEQHPYANAVNEKDYCGIDPADLKEFYRQRINALKCRIVLSGNVSEEILQHVEKNFSSLGVPQTPPPEKSFHVSPSPAGRYQINKADTVQSSLRIGKTGVMITEKDYAGFQLLNAVLGGYFGSRLMSNIREDKGYTYGINSFNVSMPDSSYWCIATDVNREHTEAAISETLKEIKKLQTVLIPEDELMLVKNYFHGDLLRELDGVFSQADSLKHKLNYGLDNRIYISMIEQVNCLSSKHLLELANKYMKIDDLYIVTAGEG